MSQPSVLLPKLEAIDGKLHLLWTDAGGVARRFAIDYLSKEFQYRLRTSLRARDLLVRAVGAGRAKPVVWDFTLGLGYDLIQLAAWGCRVKAWERNPFIFALVANALERLRLDAKGAEWAERIELHQGDALADAFGERGDQPDVIYLDPMYPQAGRSRPRKELVVLRDLVGDDMDADKLFAVAWAKARLRVVVKRPDKAPVLVVEPKAHHSLAGKTVRFDVYNK